MRQARIGCVGRLRENIRQMHAGEHAAEGIGCAAAGDVHANAAPQTIVNMRNAMIRRKVSLIFIFLSLDARHPTSDRRSHTGHRTHKSVRAANGGARSHQA